MKQAPMVGIFGRRGCGKSTLARAIARHQARVVVWDYCGEYGPLALCCEDADSLADYLDWGAGKRFAAVRFIPQLGDVDEFEEFCEVVYESQNLVVVIEEVAAVCHAAWLSPAFGRIVRQGRHRALGLLWATQRLNEVSRTLTALTDVWVGFSTSEPNDLQALAARAGRDYAEDVASLPRFKWLGYDVDTQTAFENKEKLLESWGAPAKWNLPTVIKANSDNKKRRHLFGGIL